MVRCLEGGWLPADFVSGLMPAPPMKADRVYLSFLALFFFIRKQEETTDASRL
jgi:hypothetical protein